MTNRYAPIHSIFAFYLPPCNPNPLTVSIVSQISFARTVTGGNGTIGNILSGSMWNVGSAVQIQVNTGSYSIIGNSTGISCNFGGNTFPATINFNSSPAVLTDVFGQCFVVLQQGINFGHTSNGGCINNSGPLLTPPANAVSL